MLLGYNKYADEATLFLDEEGEKRKLENDFHDVETPKSKENPKVGKHNSQGSQR